jgi:hypothetical protein
MENCTVTMLLTRIAPESVSHCILYREGWHHCFNLILSTNSWLAILLQLPLSTMIWHNLSLTIPRVWKRLCHWLFSSLPTFTLSTQREMKQLLSSTSAWMSFSLPLNTSSGYLSYSWSLADSHSLFSLTIIVLRLGHSAAIWPHPWYLWHLISWLLAVDVADVASMVAIGRLLSEHGAGEEAEDDAALEVELGKELLGAALWERPLEKDVFGCCWRYGTAENDLPGFSCWIFLSVCIAWSTWSCKLLYGNISTNPEISALRP